MRTSIAHIPGRNQHFRQLIIKFAVVWLYSTNTPRPNAYDIFLMPTLRPKPLISRTPFVN